MLSTALGRAYLDVRRQCRTSIRSSSASESILEFATQSLAFLSMEAEEIPFNSRVPGKSYVGFRRDGVLSRPANSALFSNDRAFITETWQTWKDVPLAPSEALRLMYTIGLAPCLAMELFDRQNKKGPASYFECFIGHVMSCLLGAEPSTRARLELGDRAVLMTMDFLFDLGFAGPKFHVPVKLSTRERVVQAWAHQRMLDCGYGDGVFRGILVVFGETKLDSRTHEVVEICVPDQWLAYQRLLAKMDRIYYFDMPAKYLELTQRYPETISMRSFGDIFTEIAEVLR